MAVSPKAFGCVNNTIRLRSGRYLDLADPKPDQFTFMDIAGALSKICRFGGQINLFYSVAEHCVHCTNQGCRDGLPLDTQAALLMHDAAEAFIGDMVKPLKIMLPGYDEVEKKMEAAIAEKFLIDFDRESYSVHKIDQEMLIAERVALFSRDDVVWTGERDVRKVSIRFECWEPNQSEIQFCKMARQIGLNISE